ncbi:glutathione synthase/RimK-type ligase-like ATP-grasp enzyme [Virgibacillus natechei]|uniref:Glutathione synthase/RimK-type ligase-like ATP-grasp enzyme n=1 Tax=Virgibacillus natechei TaxID=1216297 RepID=A0ABS4IE37_9BACI|nr:hypothetical protein [Virgibacillus natechei]MBP1969193.1 glutathione synthase/RimK-type ligase-like ATP-grasp enzyme [Virgibacillus natechei]UZD12359.1 hypothetical protein OLD84_15810 [Virgibacillus natechei]
MKIGVIITPERKRENIINAFKDLDIEYDFIDLMADEWDSYLEKDYDGYLIYPPSFPDEWKSLFMKRLFLLKDMLKGKSLPSLDSIIMYESKITMHDYYKVNNLPHIESHSFYNYQQAVEYGKKCRLPVVIKEDSGSGAIGVKIISRRQQLLRVIRRSFLLNNKIRKYNSIKSIKNSLKAKLYPYKIFLDSKKQFLPKSSNSSGVIHIQSYVKIKNEWRVIRIGDSFFGHKKLEDEKGFHSGSLNKGWGHVKSDLLNLVKEWSDKLQLESMCFDIFEDYEGNYYINELQVMFGTSTDAQLIVDNKVGRYLFNGGWVFEEGNFTRNGCNNLRIELLIEGLSGYRDC